MNKPILIIDEKPFLSHDNVAREAYRLLRERLVQFGGIEVVEFAWENDPDWILPEIPSPGFSELVEGRKFIFTHNSYPDSKDPHPLFPDKRINEFRKAIEGKAELIRFSGHMGMRGLSASEFESYQHKGTRPAILLIKGDYRIYRDELYSNLDIFVRHILKNDFREPFFQLLQNGQNAFHMVALSLLNSIKKTIFTEKKSILNSVAERHEKIPVPGWNSQIGDSRFEEILRLTGKPESDLIKARNWIQDRKIRYNSPADYLSDIEKVIEKIKERPLI
jgi:hypothetical protein